MAGFFPSGYLCEADHRVSLVSCDGGANSAGADGITAINGVVPEPGSTGLGGLGARSQ